MPALDIRSDWRPGAPITWTADLLGRRHDVKGEVVRADAEATLEYRYTNPLNRVDHVVSIELADDGPGTRVSVTEQGSRNDGA